MLKYRLIFGTLMILLFAGLVFLDGYLDGSICAGSDPSFFMVKGTILCVLVILMAIPAQIEITHLIGRVGAKSFLPVTLVGTILLATNGYWKQFGQTREFHLYSVLFLLALSVMAVFFYQARRFGTKGVIVNCSANLFTMLYLGLLSSFALAIRIEFGLWEFVMFIIVVKCADIGAYTVGRLFGKHKFSPNISPKKTWEGMAGGVIFAGLAGVLCAIFFYIMSWQSGVVFGALFAFVGQFGDLAESMIKRDAEQKDSAHNVPGFGGVLDIIDSPLIAAPVAYVFFLIVVA